MQRRAMVDCKLETVSPGETPDSPAGSVLGGLLAPLRLPERVIEALDSLVESTRELKPIRSELARVRKQTEPLDKLLPALEGIRKQTEPLAEMPPALEHVRQELGSRLDSLLGVVVKLESDESHLNKTVSVLADEVTAMHKTVSGLQDDIQRLTDRLPDPDAPGPLEKARDVLTGSGN